MKSIISSTYDDKYLFFIPIVTFCWNKIGVDVICFVPYLKDSSPYWGKHFLITDTMAKNKLNAIAYHFAAPEHKEATYAQCARLYGGCLDLPEDKVLVTGDCDMAVFGSKFSELNDGNIHSLGGDLLDVEQMKQYPLCYIAMPVKDWRRIMDVENKSYQQCLDETVGVIECDHFKGNQWSLDQNTIYSKFSKHEVKPLIHNRAKYPERFARNRYDRDDAYILSRLSLDAVDFHMNRPGYEENNFEIIMTILKYHYPNDDLNWIREYRNKYIELL